MRLGFVVLIVSWWNIDVSDSFSSRLGIASMGCTLNNTRQSRVLRGRLYQIQRSLPDMAMRRHREFRWDSQNSFYWFFPPLIRRTTDRDAGYTAWSQKVFLISRSVFLLLMTRWESAVLPMVGWSWRMTILSRWLYSIHSLVNSSTFLRSVD